MNMNIHDNYLQVIERIATAAESAGRKPDDIHLVVVTKTHPIDVIQAVLDDGVTNLGENYVEEAIPKINGITKSESLNWHMIGHVQSRKALSVCKYFQYLHSLDSVKLAERLSIYAVEMDKIIPVMLEVNVGGEASKSGWDISIDENWTKMLPDVGKIIALPGLKLIGAMTIPPYSTNPEDSRIYYRRLRKFKDFISNQFNMSEFNDLSMGMSNDYEVAIQEGATWVRIGQAILGPRSR